MRMLLKEERYARVRAGSVTAGIIDVINVFYVF